MSFFKKISNIADLKVAYRKLALANHPDRGGSEEVMKEINIEYDIVYNILSRSEVVTETAYQTRSEFYTQNGWKGENYSSDLFTTDIAKLVRKYVKIAFPKCKFSVTSDYNQISVSLMKADFNPFAGESKTYAQINHYFINESERFTPYAKRMFSMILNFMNSYRYDDSDSSIDYFNTNFYIHMEIGKYGKPFVQTANNSYSDCMDVDTAA